jgi:hypothetical protein
LVHEAPNEPPARTGTVAVVWTKPEGICAGDAVAKSRIVAIVSAWTKFFIELLLARR